MLLKYITLVSGFNYLIFSFVLLLKNVPNKKANLVLGFVFLMMSVYSIMLSYYYTALLEKNYYYLIHYIPADYILVLLLGPFMFFYINIILNKPVLKYSWIHLIVIIPAIVFNVYFAQLPVKERIDLLIVNFEVGIWQTNLLNALFYVQMTIYLIIGYFIIRKQLKISSKVTTDSVQVDISWLETLLLIDIAIMVLSAPISFYLANERSNIIIAQLAMDIQLVYIFVKSAWQTGIFPVEVVALEQKNKESILKIADDKVEDYFRTLVTFMESEKPYLLEECNLITVSEQTGISVHHLSNIINSRIAKNFPDFINEYRINEAKKILSSNHSEKVTLEAVGYECGFGSKSSFNKAFKKQTNLTPSQFRQQSKSIS
jgi:AraC-like DNA-binding protein